MQIIHSSALKMSPTVEQNKIIHKNGICDRWTVLSNLVNVTDEDLLLKF